MEKLFYLGFSLFPGIGPHLFEKLLNKFISTETAWNASEEELKTILGEITLKKFLLFRESIDLKKEYEKIIKNDIQVIILKDKKYSSLLKKIPHPPFVLYVKGDVAILSVSKTIAVVGTRKITQYGREVTELLTQDLVSAGFVIVSGLAFGVDAAAHMTTIKNNGKTIAVLGCGVDCCYPRENQKIYDAILESGGAIVSTFPPGMQATVGSFPARNAIVAGLSTGILVTEGAVDSGALITADYGKKFDRPVFAVPGQITSSLSKGVNNLVKNGAIAVTNSGDILDRLGIIAKGKSQIPSTKQQIQGTKEEQEILRLLENSPLHFDEIVRRIKKDSKTVGSLLSLMELKGMIKNIASIYSLQQ